MGFWHYYLKRKELGQIIRAAGVDESEVFAYEARLYSETVTGTEQQAEQPVPLGGAKPSN